jgi:TonB family protein
MKIKISEPCHENWQKMNQNDKGRHCEKCSKTVIDFTTKSRGEIMIYLLENPNEKTCGRLFRNQFEFKEEDIPVLLNALSKPRFSRNAFLILALVCASLSSCTNEKSNHGQNQTKKNSVKVNINEGIDSLNTYADTSSENQKNNSIIPKIILPIEYIPIPYPDPEPPVVGAMEFYPPEPPLDFQNETKDSILDYAEVMPEFPGGMQAYLKYLELNIQYPELCKEMGVEGKVFVRFIVHSDGSNTQFRVLKGVHPELDKEAIRVLTKMPKWIPGRQNGKSVPVNMTVPVHFRLD